MRLNLSNSLTTFKQLFDDFLISSKAKGLAEKTLKSYASHAKTLEYYMNLDVPVEEMKQRDFEVVINAMRDKGLSPNTIQSYLRTISAFFSWCRLNGVYAPEVPKFKGVEVVKDTYTDEELLVLLKKPDLKKCNFSEYRNWVIVNLFMDCGCRAATIRAIEIRDLDLVNGLISYRHTKNRKTQVLPLSSEMMSILQEYGHGTELVMKISTGQIFDCQEYCPVVMDKNRTLR